ncbi:MAG: IS607 family transposase [Clostridiales bacterium]|nr:IS607 family transposase [Clostridiales bacterium]
MIDLFLFLWQSMPMKLSEWAKKRGITYKTAWRWVKEGKMPVPFEITPSGTILVHEPEAPKKGLVALYARVSSSDQKADLARQVVRLLEFANAQGLSVGKTVKEVGPGLNGRRKELIKLLSDPNVTTIVVEHRDQLTRRNNASFSPNTPGRPASPTTGALRGGSRSTKKKAAQRTRWSSTRN